MTRHRRLRLAALFWGVLAALVAVDQWRGFDRHDRFDEPLPWALGSGRSDVAKGAHCAAAPRKP